MSFKVIYLLVEGTNDSEYVGQTTQPFAEDFKQHCWCKTSNIGRAIRKHGAENFTKAILKVCETQAKLDYWERIPESVAKMSRKGKKIPPKQNQNFQQNRFVSVPSSLSKRKFFMILWVRHRDFTKSITQHYPNL